MTLKDFLFDIADTHRQLEILKQTEPEEEGYMWKGTIEVFLVEEVNYVVTDRPHWASGSPLPSPSFLTPAGPCSVSPATTESPGGGQGKHLAKSRAGAMLEKVRLQPQQITLDPLDNASRWGIPIWPLEKVLKWLGRFNSKCEDNKPSTSFKKGLEGCQTLQEPFIKLETSTRHCPVFKEFSVWPTITLDLELSGSPFTATRTRNAEDKVLLQLDKNDWKNEPTNTISELRMTRKASYKVHQEDIVTIPLAGFCEICQDGYTDQRAHIKSERHTQFVNNDHNFLALDSLISGRSSMETFLKTNGASELTQCSMLGSTRRSLRSVVRVSPPPQHATRSSTLNMRQTLEEKHLAKVVHQSESLEVQCNGLLTHCYETRYGGKAPAPVRRSYWDDRAKPRRARTTSATYWSGLEEPSQLSPTTSESGHRLRSRGQLWLPKNLLGTTAEDERNSQRLVVQCPEDSPGIKCTKSSPEIKCEDNGNNDGDSVVKDSRPKHAVKSYRGNTLVIRKKRPSAEEKLIEDNKAYYKLEVRNNKLRSNRYYIAEKESDMSKPNVEDTDLSGEKHKVVVESVVKVKKKPRRSELSVLSDEAENFMFGEPTRQETSEESSDETAEESIEAKQDKLPTNDRTNTPKNNKEKDVPVTCIKQEEESTPGQISSHDDSSLCSVETCSGGSSCDTRKKRRTHAEAFIHDNIDYYKFEIPGSRLRFQGTHLFSTTLPTNTEEPKFCGFSEIETTYPLSEYIKHKNSDTNPGCSDIPATGKEIVPKAPELVKKYDSKSKTNNDGSNNRIDNNDSNNKINNHESHSKSNNEYSNNKTNTEEPISKTKIGNITTSIVEDIHFSFETIPENEPWYKTYKRQDEGEEIYYAQSDTVSWKTFLLPYEMRRSEVQVPAHISSAPNEPGPSEEARRGMKLKKRKKRKSRFAHLLDKKPRKSPRCHASTLAILSSLMHHRKRKEPYKIKEEPPFHAEPAPQEDTATHGDTDDSGGDDTRLFDAERVAEDSVEVAKPKPEELKEMERNIDKLLSMDNDNLSDSSHGDTEGLLPAKLSESCSRKRTSLERRKSSTQKRKSSSSVKRFNFTTVNNQEPVDIDPTVLEELSLMIDGRTNQTAVLTKHNNAPDSDVLTLLENFSKCWCMEPVSSYIPSGGSNTSRVDMNVPTIVEASCNSSECGTSSTGDSSIVPLTSSEKLKVHFRKRKRKKNMTGWPVEKPRKKGLKRLVELDIKCEVSGYESLRIVSEERDCIKVEIEENSNDMDLGKEQDCVGSEVNTCERFSGAHNNSESKVKISEQSSITQKDSLESKVNLIEQWSNVQDKTRDIDGQSINSQNKKNVRPTVVKTLIADLPRSGKTGILLRTLSIDTSEYQPCVRVTKITNIADIISCSQIKGSVNSRRLRSASSSSLLLERENGDFKCVFLPPNVTSLQQPMDEGVIECTKQHYRTAPQTTLGRGSGWNGNPNVEVCNCLLSSTCGILRHGNERLHQSNLRYSRCSK
uniref:DBF4-type domain-containing protein n=1 Tax=Timema genevievae TaxID=629358 RepID=A0A7R9JT73_TIMGE|nr:unnamed protein product [Timema genevievae]